MARTGRMLAQVTIAIVATLWLPSPATRADERSATATSVAERAAGPVPLRQPSRPLLRPAAKSISAADDRDGVSLTQGLPDWKSLAASLGLVLALFLIMAWALKRSLPKGAGKLPGEVVQVLGRAPLAGRQHVHLLRCGGKLLLVNVTPSGVEALTEITDPVEVDRLAGLCQQQQASSATAAFREVLDRFGRERPNV